MKKLIFLVTLLLTVGMSKAQMHNPVHWTFSVKDVSKTEKELMFSAKIDAHWHVYGLHLPQDGPTPTSIEFKSISGAELVGEVTSPSQLITKYDEMFGMEINWYENEVTFVQRIKLTGEKYDIQGVLRFMCCDDQSCMPPTAEDFAFSGEGLSAADIAAAAPAKPKAEPKKESVKPVTAQKSEPKKEVKTAVATPKAEPKKAEATPVEAPKEAVAVAEPASAPAADLWTPVIDKLQARGEESAAADTSLWFIFISGFVGGLLALLTPCVWPMIPMTVSFFLKRTKDRSRSIRDAIIYGLGIIIIYVGLGLLITIVFGASALNSLATNAVFNIIFFLLLVVFAISFFGAFELTLPASWTTKLDSKADSTSGLISIFFMAFTLVLVSFSCTGPIIGTLLVQAASMGVTVGPAIGMFGFALALAVPFAFFAIFPSMLQSLPRSGGWLNSVKVVLAFLELALALKFLSVADLAYGWRILDREVFVSLWIVIFALLGLYLLGKLRFSHDSEVKHVSVFRLFLAMISLAFAIYLVPGLWGAPLKSISAFAPPLTTQDFNLYEDEVHAAFTDYDEGMANAKKVNKPVLVDFSGFGCVNCRKMEAAVWTDPAVKEVIENDYVLITLMVDDKAELPEPIKIEEYGKQRTLYTVGDRWSYLQRYKFGANAQPFYVLLDTDGNPVGPSYSYKEDVPAYLNFLKNGVKVFNEENKR